MSDRIARKLADRTVARDIRIVSAMVEVYCKGNHADRPRRAVESDAEAAGVYRSHPPVVCEECADLVRYAEKRRIYCPKDPKPFCAYCDTHCYAPDKRAVIRDVMRYAGPRSMGTRHFFAALRHAAEGRAARRKHLARLKAEGITEQEFRRRVAENAPASEATDGHEGRGEKERGTDGRP